ncbi:MAG: hypothetical protein WKF84_19600 [Pyrinomonadaceae bacterium]
MRRSSAACIASLRMERQEQAASYNYPLSDVLMSGFAMLFFQDPSLLAFQERMLKKRSAATGDDVWRCGGAERIADARAA